MVGLEDEVLDNKWKQSSSHENNHKILFKSLKFGKKTGSMHFDFFTRTWYFDFGGF